VLSGSRRWSVERADCLEFLAALPTAGIDMVIGSPPYAEKGERYDGDSRRWDTCAWVEWMLRVTAAAVRVSRGYVLWVVNGAVRDGVYRPACEGLVWEYWKRHDGGTERPCIWHKNAPPNRRDWFGNDWEYVLAFKPVAKPYFDWKAAAAPPRYTCGGRFRQRSAKGGQRRLGNEYPKKDLARPRAVFRVTVGGGHLGSELAHLSEAPLPERLVEPLVLTCCPPDGIVCDPFSGSGTTGKVAVAHGRRFVGCDLRESQVELARQRISSKTTVAAGGSVE
jgi:DNA modification methylase